MSGLYDQIGWSPESVKIFMESLTPSKSNISLNAANTTTPDNCDDHGGPKRSIGSPICHPSVDRVSKLMNNRKSPPFLQSTRLQSKSISPVKMQNLETIQDGSDESAKVQLKPENKFSTAKTFLLSIQDKENTMAHTNLQFTDMLSKSQQVSKSLDISVLEKPLPNGWLLYKHQKEAILTCLSVGRSILAFDMGLGKTVIGLLWARTVCKSAANCVASVIAPCTLIEVWRREASMPGFQLLSTQTKSYSRHSADAPSILFLSW